MNVIDVYDLKSNTWLYRQPATPANKTDSTPIPRVKPCTVIARAKDGSSYNIYMFGGWDGDPNSSVGYNDLWVLSIPSFQWFLVDNGLSNAKGAPPKYEAMTCYIVGGGSKMLVYGGRARPKTYQCDKTSIHVFDMTKLIWEEVYDPNGGEYEVPSKIYNVIGGGPHGGATLLPTSEMSNPDMQATFTEIIKKTKQTNSTSTNTNSTSTNTNRTSTNTDSTRTNTENSKNGVSGGTIVGIVVGALVGISLISLGILWLRKRSKARTQGLPGSNNNPLAEMPSPFPPGELHQYEFSPPAQELHAYMPNEMASPNDEVHTGASYYNPVKPELSVKRTEDAMYQ